MKLTKYKVGLLSLVIFLSVGMLLGANSAVLAETLDKSGFQALTGEYLSEQGYENGDTLELDFEEVTQTTSLLVDVDVTIEPTDQYETVTLKQGDGSDAWDGSLRDKAAGDDLGDEVDAAIVVLSNGVSLDSLEFMPSNDPTDSGDYSGGDFDGPVNAIEVDCCVTDDDKSLRFHNMAMPVSGSDGGFINGFKFDGSVSGVLSCGLGGLEYDGEGIYFSDVRLEGGNAEGINGNGVLFTGEVANVANLHFEEFYAGDISEYPDDYISYDETDPIVYGGNGILFNNSGTVKHITIMDSERTSPSVSERPFALEENASDGIMVNGANVKEVSGFEISNARFENNTGAGIFIKGNQSVGDPISSLGMSIKDTSIFDNNYGILVASKDASNDLDSQDYSPVKVEGVHLGENLVVRDNKYGGALFNVQVVDGSKSSPALTVSDSQFHRDETDSDSDKNDQDFGLLVDAYEGIFGVDISDSTFRYHGETISGAGIELRTPIADEYEGDLTVDYYDQIDGVTIKNTSSQYNDGAGVLIAGNVVKDVDILSSGSSKAKFSGNGDADVSDSVSGRSGIIIFGPDRVSDLKVTGQSDGGEVLANYNDEYGLLVESVEEIYGVEVANAQFGDEVNDNGNGESGVSLATIGTESDYNIGSDDSAGAINFDNVAASGNDGHGIEIDSAGSFINPSDNIFVNDSVFRQNQADGLHLYAAENIKRPRVEISTFVGNNVTGGEAGIFLGADGEEIRGTGSGDIVDNVVADNEIGIAVYDPVTDVYVDTIIDFSVKGNKTTHPDNSEHDGNNWANLVLAAENLNSVSVEENLLISAYDDSDEAANTNYGLWLEANDSSANISVENNEFDSGAEGFCVGIGTAILLDAKKTTIEQNKIDGFDTAIEVLKENSGSTSADDTSNQINKNDILGCCTLIDASSLDYGNGEKVDARGNYWGEDLSKSDLKPNFKSDSSNPFDQIYVVPLRDEPVDVIEDVTITLDVVTSNPKVNESVELDYVISNNTFSSMTVDGDLKITNPDGDTVYDEKVEQSSTISSDSEISDTIQFTPGVEGDFEAEMSVDDGDYTETINFTVGDGDGEPGDPYWGENSEPAKSGILPAPIDGDKAPYLEIADVDGNPVDSNPKSVKVFDMSGNKVEEITEDFDNMTELNKLENGLYLYVVDLENGQSPVMKFVVKS